MKRHAFALLLLRILAVFGLAASGASLGEDLFDAREFCGFNSGCEAVAASPYSRPLGIPLPVAGLLGFGSILALSLFPKTVRFALPLGWATGVAGAILVLIQIFAVGRLCPLCLVADGAGIGLGTAGLFLRRAVPPTTASATRSIWAAVALLAAAGPLAWDWASSAPPPPDQILALRATEGITVVEVTDFDCEHCQKTDAVLQAVLKGREGIHFVRVVCPMPKHANARPAAKAYLAAVKQGKGEAMAGALYGTSNRTPEGCRELARSLGLNLIEFDRVTTDRATDAELNATVAWVKTAGPGLPLLWIQNTLIHGTPTAAELEVALRQAGPK